MENPKTNRLSKNPSRISLKDIPPLDPSSIPFYSSLKPRTSMEPVGVPKQRDEEKSELKLKMVNEIEEDNVKSSFSNIQIDPNSTRTVSLTEEEEKKKKKLVPKPEEDIKPKSKDRGPDESMKGSAKSLLHERCISNRWKPPAYDCCKVEGPCHMRLFTYKVVLEIRDSSGTTVLECFGSPKLKKKTAAEHAAEGALWYLEHVQREPTKSHQQ